MPQLIRIAAVADLPPEGEAREFPLGEKMVCVANINGRYSAMDNICLHRGGPLGQGVVMDTKIVCPWHGWVWDPVTGRTDDDPNAKIPVYPIKIEGNEVLIEI